MSNFQSTVNINYGFGVIGEMFQDEPSRVESLIVNSSGAGNTVGLAYTKSNTTNIATLGGAIVNGTNVFAGILVNPKVYASLGTTAGTLTPTLVIPDNTQAEFLTFGTIVVALTGSANIGDIVQYNNTTGALSALAPGSTVTTGNTFIPNCVVYKFPTTGAGLVAIRITN